ncbi:unnamed protein product [Ostreobium quekettii]|uniref:Uncharacterized protein n=1 Tax=Ostreobium quekettii TaxID=121088 RepID=A0A8S1IPW5_9CHLO|nr:unnamed protein product [Ostreobium quekettii]|eukprot:evm.model.scf_9.16 EVM.evm.TU.scf_9.16   scf_9:209463-220707(-)
MAKQWIDMGRESLRERLLLAQVRHRDWTLDRGGVVYKRLREENRLASLVENGRHAGKSRVQFVGVHWLKIRFHIWRRDFYTSLTNLSLAKCLFMFFITLLSLLCIWATIYHFAYHHDPSCFDGFDSRFQPAFMFALATQQTIGYGTRAVTHCWTATLLVTVHSLTSTVVYTFLTGVVFARIANPARRGRTILISDSAVIGRRDGVLKFMFRIGDMRPGTVMDPHVTAHLFLCDPRRRSAEGERLPVVAQRLPLKFVSGSMLLPVVVEHTIDESSPLHGHNHTTLEDVSAEIVVTFGGQTEAGGVFTARQSYLSSEIHWGYIFTPIVKPPTGDKTTYDVDLLRFHSIEPQDLGLGDNPRWEMSDFVRSHNPSQLPSSELGENNLAISDCVLVAPRNGSLCLMFRVGDRRPSDSREASISAYLYRWSGQNGQRWSTEDSPFACEKLRLDREQVLLRFPVTVCHVIDDTSPLRSWREADGMQRDATAEICVVMSSGPWIQRMTYSVATHAKRDFHFAPVVLPPEAAVDGHQQSTPSIDWSAFHRSERIGDRHGPGCGEIKPAPMTTKGSKR